MAKERLNRASFWVQQWEVLSGEEQMQYRELSFRVRTASGIVAKKKRGFQTFVNSFSGAELVSWLRQQDVCSSRTEGQSVGQWLVAGNFLHHVSDAKEFVDKKSALYRFYEDEDADAAQSVRSLISGARCYGWIKCVSGLGILPQTDVYAVLQEDEHAIHFFRTDISSSPLTSVQLDVLRKEDCVTVSTDGAKRVSFQLSPRHTLAFDVDDLGKWLKPLKEVTEVDNKLYDSAPGSESAYDEVSIGSEDGGGESPEKGEQQQGLAREYGVNIVSFGDALRRRSGSLVAAVQDLGLGTQLEGDDLLLLETDIQARASRILAHSGVLPEALQRDVPALLVALRKAASEGGMEVGKHTWLGMTFHSCFKGSELIDWLRPRLGASPASVKAYCEQLRRAGFYAHTFKSKSFSTTCFFFWAADDRYNELVFQEERLRRSAAAGAARAR